MWSPNEQHQDGAMERGQNPFRNEDETPRMVLGAIQVFTFAIALFMLFVISLN